jgi:NADPH:quinone reductase-like Zn-dependent oxidoreductase
MVDTMRAAFYRSYGGPEVLEVGEMEAPRPGDHQILVRVLAAGINPVDWKIRSGHLRPFASATFPMIPGSDLAGEVVEVGSEVARFRPGDAVYGLLQPAAGGACGELAAVPASAAAPMPENLSFTEAAAVPMAALTALQALRDKGRIAPGMRVLIHGGSGGVGSFAVQIARSLGARVGAVASTGNQELLRELGAEETFDYTTEDFTLRDQVWDLVFDAVGNRTYNEVASVLSREGRYVTTLPSFGLFLAVFATRLAGIFGYGRRAAVMMLDARGDELEELAEWIGGGEIRPLIHRTYPLEEIGDAHAESETGHVRGKIVVTLGG